MFTLVGAALLGAGPAHADLFGPISLASEGSVAGGAAQQAEYAHDSAISGNGRYVAFDGSVGGVTGVWRRDLMTGAIVQVAGGDAELPSISEDGQRISFTTNEGRSLPAITDDRPDEAPVREAVNVYVRDMSAGPLEGGAFIVASAASGSSEPLSYSGAGATFGSVAVGRTAISADGNEVAFVTTAVSDLTDPGTPGEPNTPALQVAVRYIASAETKLVSVERETGGPVSANAGGSTFGAVYPGVTPQFRAPPAYGEWGQNAPPGASISADGSSVAWMGEDVELQAQMLPAESPGPLYTEPLWRRIAPGSETATERVTGGSEPLSPACQATGELALPSAQQQSAADPCLGPFVVNLAGSSASFGIWPDEGGTADGLGDFVPRLSANGSKVAFISGALPVAAGENYNAARRVGEEADLYVADMSPGLSRSAALTTVTALAGAEGVADTEPIYEFGISADGEQVAFTTRRTAFRVSSPAFISEPAAEPGLSELYDADLHDATLTRVTHGYEGGPSEQPHGPKEQGEEDAYGGHGTHVSWGAQSPSFAAGGTLLAFSSTASNLAFGDGNTPPAGPLDGSDAFVLERVVLGAMPTPQYISPGPQTPTEPAWDLGVTSLSRRDGSVLLYVLVPGSGALRVGAQSTLRLSPAAKKAHARRASASHGRARSASRGRSKAAVVSRTVASAARSVAADGEELLTLVLRLGKKYAALGSRRGGLSASVSVAFAAPGHPTLRRSLRVTFARTVKAKHAAQKAGTRRTRR